MEEKKHEEETNVASISLQSTMQSKVGEKAGSRMYVETKVRGKKLHYSKQR